VMKTQLVINIPSGQLLFEDVCIVNKPDVDAMLRTYSDLKPAGLQSIGLDFRDQTIRELKEQLEHWRNLNATHVRQCDEQTQELIKLRESDKAHLTHIERLQRDNSELNVENARIHKLIALTTEEKDRDLEDADEKLVKERLVHGKQLENNARTIARLEQTGQELLNRIARQLETIEKQRQQIEELSDETRRESPDLERDSLASKLDAIRDLVLKLDRRIRWALKYADDRGVRFPVFNSEGPAITPQCFAGVFGLSIEDVIAVARKKFSCPLKDNEILLHPDNAIRLAAFFTPIEYIQQIEEILS
jgi:hypothetical protein